MIEEQITALLEEKFKEEDFLDCFLIEVKLHANKKLDVFVDSDSGIDFNKCRLLSRYLEKHIDEGAWLGEKYVLEVSSPGVGRPLQFIRQYPKNIGRKLEIALQDGSKKTALLVAVHEESILVEEKVRIKEGKRKKTQVIQTEIALADIKKTTVKIAF